MYKVVISETILKKLQCIPEADLLRFYEKIEIIQRDPFTVIPFTKRLKNSFYYRFRFGNYRCVYSIDTEIITITVIDVNHRKEIYRRKK